MKDKVGDSDNEKGLIWTNFWWLVLLIVCLILFNYGGVLFSVVSNLFELNNAPLPTTTFSDIPTFQSASVTPTVTALFINVTSGVGIISPVTPSPTKAPLQGASTPTVIQTTQATHSAISTPTPKKVSATPKTPVTLLPITLTSSLTPIPTTRTPSITPIPTIRTPSLTPIPTTLIPTITPIPNTLTPTRTPIPPTRTPTPTNTIKNIEQCEDTIDNDGDSFADWPLDPQCKNKNDDDESR